MPTPLGNRIRQRRIKLGLTLEGLAKKVGSSKSYIWELENKDIARPSAEKIDAIAQALDTTAAYLVAAYDVTEANELDAAFFRKYQSMDPDSKRLLQKMLKSLDEED